MAIPFIRRSAVTWVAALLFSGAAMTALSALHLRTAPPQAQSELVAVDYRLRNLVLATDGHVLGSLDGTLYRILDGGSRLQEVARYPEPVHGIHVTAGGTIMVATDRDPHGPATPCTIHLLDPSTGVSRAVKTIEGGTALWWSLASDAADNLYVGEYGPKLPGISKRVWKSSDGGRTWEVVFRARERPGTHIHRVAVDPYTDDVWVSVGDGANRGVFRSTDGGGSWERMLDSQATGVAFTAEGIYWGADDRRGGRVTRVDRATGRTGDVLDSSHFGDFGGSIYSMTAGEDGFIYAPTMKYSSQSHRAALWRGHMDAWALVTELPTNERGAVNAETIAGPDSDGWIHMTGFKLRPPPAHGPATAAAATPRAQETLSAGTDG